MSTGYEIGFIINAGIVESCHYSEEVYEQSKEILTDAAKTVTDEDLDRFIILANSMKGFDITDELAEITCRYC